MPDQGFLGEREQVLDRATAAGDDDHVDGGVGLQLVERGNHLGNGLRALDGGIDDLHLHARPPVLRHGEHIAFGGRSTSGDQTHPRRQEGQWTLQPRVEEPFGGERPLELLDSCQQLADADVLDPGDPQ